MQQNDPLSFRKFFTKAAPALSKPSGSSNDSSASRYAARRQRRITAPSSRSRAPSSSSNPSTQPSVYEVRSETELEAAFACAERDCLQAPYVSETPHLLTHRVEIAAKVAITRLPAMYPFREYVQSGGLMSYGSDL